MIKPPLLALTEFSTGGQESWCLFVVRNILRVVHRHSGDKCFPQQFSLGDTPEGYSDCERLLLNHDARILGPQRRRIQSGGRDEA